MTPLSVLDLSPITQGSDAAQSLRNTLDLARHCEKWGYRRFWLAEHHGMPGIASAATSVVIGHVAAGTSTIRVGAGGIMLPNHSPLVIAEQFGTLESLFPGRIDLGLGRAPGSDQLTARALRRNLASDADEFPLDVQELLDYLSDEPRQAVRAVPGMGTKVPLWILGSSLYGAQVAAALGLPYAFASHFAPAQMLEAIAVYRARFKPSAQLAQSYVMLGFNVFAADTAEDARYRATSMQQAFVNLRSGRPSALPPPMEGYLEKLGPQERALLDQVLSCSAVGSPEMVHEAIKAFIARTGADELIISGAMFDHAAGLRPHGCAGIGNDKNQEPPMKITRLDVPQCSVGEGPVWDVQSQRLYWIDILQKNVHCLDPATGTTQSWSVPNIIGSMAIRKTGGAIVALANGVHTLDFATGECRMLATSPDLNEQVQLADGKVDRRGRFIVGSSDRGMKEARGKLYALDPGATALRQIDADIFLANGPCWSPDDSVFYHADSIRKLIYAYDYDIATGTLANRRPFASTETLGGIPDGATVDSEGHVWSAICEGGKLVRFRPDGSIERMVEMPLKLPGSAMFGGAGL